MASATIHLLMLTFTLMLFTGQGQEAKNQLNCYVCESEDTSACEDPADTSTFASAYCNTLIYPSPREEDQRSVIDRTLAEGVDGKFRGIPLLAEILGKKGNERSILPFKYACLKVVFTSDDRKATTRTCGKVRSDIKDVCDFINQEADPRVKVHKCSSCETDNCNSGPLLKISFLTIILNTFLLIL